MNPPRSILLIKPGSMGDVIHALPVAAALHEAWPQSKITWLIDPRWSPILAGNPAVAAVHHFPRESFRGLGGIVRAAKWSFELARLRPDLALDLQGLLRSGLTARLSLAKQTMGLSDAREGARFLYQRTARLGDVQHAVDRYLTCLPALGIAVPEKKTFPIAVPRELLTRSITDDYVVLHPFARGEAKSLGAAEIEALVTELSAKSGRTIVLVGFGPALGDFGGRVVNLVGQTQLGELIALIAKARFVISVDSGPMHLAAALGVPLLGIHTWSDPRRVGPYSTDAWIWQGGDIRRQDLAKAPLPESPFEVREAACVGGFVAGLLDRAG